MRMLIAPDKFKGGGFEGYRLRNFRMKITE